MSNGTVAAIPPDLLTKIANLLVTRKKAQDAIRDLKKQPGPAELDWVQVFATDAAGRPVNVDGVVSKYREWAGLQDRIKALEFFHSRVNALIGYWKVSNAAAAVAALKQQLGALIQLLKSQDQDRAALDDQISELQKELKELELSVQKKKG